jgi:hypothetical protein
MSETALPIPTAPTGITTDIITMAGITIIATAIGLALAYTGNCLTNDLA